MKVLFLSFISLLLSQFNWTEAPINDLFTETEFVKTKPGPNGMLPDLVVDNITIQHQQCGVSATWSVVVCNNGEGPSPLTTVDIAIEPFPFDFEFESRRIGPLSPQTCVLLTGTVGINAGGISMSVTVDPSDNVSESNEGNNNEIGFEMC